MIYQMAEWLNNRVKDEQTALGCRSCSFESFTHILPELLAVYQNSANGEETTH